MTTYLKILFLLLITFFQLLHAETNHVSHVHGHAPIGVMGDHIHKKGELMLSYRYMFMNMDGNRNGTSRVSDQTVLQDFAVTPTDMDMEMHMLGAMYAVSDDLTLMVMIPIINLSMSHLTRSGARFQTQANGLGDIKLGALYSLLKNENHRVHLNAGLSLPTGEIDERDDIPLGSQLQLPYPMQLGSGTYDIMPGITYTGFANSLSWGAQVMGTVRLGENSNDYTLGDRFETSIWGAYAATDSFSGSLRLAWNSWDNIDGADPLLNPTIVPTADPDLRGGERLDIGIGINSLVTTGRLKGLRIALEYLFPIHQDLDGPQLETDGILTTGVQMTF